MGNINKEPTKLSPEDFFDDDKKEIAFTKVNLPYGWLGNMSPFPISYNGNIYRTAEALFQALRFSDPTICQKIIDQKSPMSAKMVAKSHKDMMTIVPMSDTDIENMKQVIMLKLEQHPELKDKLLETDGYVIIEDCTSRPRGSGLFWGAAFQNGSWVGKNILGHIWMELRNKLK